MGWVGSGRNCPPFCGLDWVVGLSWQVTKSIWSVKNLLSPSLSKPYSGKKILGHHSHIGFYTSVIRNSDTLFGGKSYRNCREISLLVVLGCGLIGLFHCANFSFVVGFAGSKKIDTSTTLIQAILTVCERNDAISGSNLFTSTTHRYTIMMYSHNKRHFTFDVCVARVLKFGRTRLN